MDQLTKSDGYLVTWIARFLGQLLVVILLAGCLFVLFEQLDDEQISSVRSSVASAREVLTYLGSSSFVLFGVAQNYVANPLNQTILRLVDTVLLSLAGIVTCLFVEVVFPVQPLEISIVDPKRAPISSLEEFLCALVFSTILVMFLRIATSLVKVHDFK